MFHVSIQWDASQCSIMKESSFTKPTRALYLTELRFLSLGKLSKAIFYLLVNADFSQKSLFFKIISGAKLSVLLMCSKFQKMNYSVQSPFKK